MSVIAAACGGGAVPEQGLQRLGSTRSGIPEETSGPGPSDDAVSADPAAAAKDLQSQTTEDPGAGDDGDDLALVVAMMASFDAAVTELAANPMAGADPAAPNRTLERWHAAVKADSPVDTDLRTRFITDLTANRVLYSPADTGPHASKLSWIHKVLQVTPENPGERPNGSATGSDDWMLGFTYCGYSPAVGRNVDTGAVVDDGRATYGGTGRAVVVGKSALLVELKDSPVRLLNDGEDNPC